MRDHDREVAAWKMRRDRHAAATTLTRAFPGVSFETASNYAAVACDPNHRHYVRSIVAEEGDRHFFPIRERADSQEAGACLDDASDFAQRLWLFDRHYALECLLLLLTDRLNFVRAHGFEEAVRNPFITETNRALLEHRIGEKSLAVNLLKGMLDLTKEANTLLEVARPGAAYTVDVVAEGLFFRASCAIEHRTTMARTLYLLFSTTQISLFPEGNTVISRLESNARAPPRPRAYPHSIPEKVAALAPQLRGRQGAALGGELFLLIDSIHELSDALYNCTEHGDGNPLWEVCYTLMLALFQALDFCTPRIDPDVREKGYFSKFLAGAFLQSPWVGDAGSAARLSELYDHLHALGIIRKFTTPSTDGTGAGGSADSFIPLSYCIVGFPLPTDDEEYVNRVYWSHTGFQALVQLSFAHWLNALYRCPDVPALDDSTLTVVDGAEPAPGAHSVELPDAEGDTALAVIRDGFSFGSRMRETLSYLVRDALSSPSKALTMLSKIASSRSFGSSAITRNGSAVPFLHVVVLELARFDCAVSRSPLGEAVQTDSGKISRTRLQMISAVEHEDALDFCGKNARNLLFLARKPESLQSPRLQRDEFQLVVQNRLPIVTEFPWILNRRQVHVKGRLPDCFEDLLALLTILLRGDPRLACRYFCAAGGADDVDVALSPFSRPLPAKFLLLHAGFLLSTDIEKLIVISGTRRARFSLELERVLDELVAEPDPLARGAGSATLQDVDFVRQAFAAHFEFLAAVGSPAAPFSAARRGSVSCSMHLADFLHARDGAVRISTTADADTAMPVPLPSLTAGSEYGQFGTLFGISTPDVAPARDTTCGVPEWSWLPRVINLLAMAASEGDREEKQWRQREYQRRLRTWETNQRVVPVEAPAKSIAELRRRLNVGNAGDTLAAPERPSPPEERRLHSRVLIALLRLVEVALADPIACDELCNMHVPLPARAMPLESVIDEAVGRGGYTNLVAILYKLVKLEVDVRVKGAVLRVLTRIATGSAAWAAVVLSGMEASQIIKTMPTELASYGGAGESIGAPADLREEHERVETEELAYDATLSFIDLLRTLHARVPLHSLGRRKRQPGILLHTSFLLQTVLRRASTRPVHPERPADTWKLLAGPMAFAADVLRRYNVASPMSPDDEEAVTVARRMIDAQITPASALDGLESTDDAAPPDGRSCDCAACLKPDPDRWYLIAVTVPTIDKDEAALESALANVFAGRTYRRATLSEVIYFCRSLAAHRRVEKGIATLEGGKFRAYTADALVYFNGRVQPDLPQGIFPVREGVGVNVNTLWILLHGDLPADHGLTVRVKVPAEQHPITAQRAKGFVAGESRFDFAASLPDLAIVTEKAKADGVREKAISFTQAPRSAGFEIMRVLHLGGDVFKSIIDVLQQAPSAHVDAAADGRIASVTAHVASKVLRKKLDALKATQQRPHPKKEEIAALWDAAHAESTKVEGTLRRGAAWPRGADGLEDLWEFSQRPGGPACIALRAVRFAVTTTTAIKERVDHSGLTALPDGTLRERAIVEERRLFVAAQRAEDAFTFAVSEGVSGIPLAADAAPLWRERALAAALALLDAALTHDEAFLQGAERLRLPDLLRPLPELLFKHGALSYISRAMGYRHDPRISLLATRVMFRLTALPRVRSLRPSDVAFEVLRATRANDESRATVAGQFIVGDIGLAYAGAGTEDNKVRTVAACLTLRPTLGGFEEESRMAVACGGKAESSLAGTSMSLFPVNILELERARLAMRERSLVRRRAILLRSVEGGGATRHASTYAAPAANVPAAPEQLQLELHSVALMPLRRRAWLGEEDEVGSLSIANVAIPVSRADGATGIRATEGWAVRFLGSGSRADPLAPTVRRNLLLELILSAITSAQGPDGLSHFCIGHALLGITFPSTSSAEVLPSRRGFCLRALAELLAGDPDVALALNFPQTFELSARLLEVLLRDSRIAHGAVDFFSAWAKESRKDTPIGLQGRFAALALLSVPLTYAPPGPVDTVVNPMPARLPGVSILGASRVVARGAGPSMNYDEHDAQDIFSGVEGELDFVATLELAHSFGLAHLQSAVAAEIHALARVFPGSSPDVYSLRTLGQLLLAPGAGIAAAPYVHRALAAVSSIATPSPVFDPYTPTGEDEPNAVRRARDVLASLSMRVTAAHGAVTSSVLTTSLQNPSSSNTPSVSSSLGVLVFIRPTARSPLQTFHLGLLRTLCFEDKCRASNDLGVAPPTDPFHLDDQTEAALKWAAQRNRHVLTLQAAYARSAAAARLMTVLVEHVLPDPDPLRANEPVPAATQADRVDFLREQLERVIAVVINFSQMPTPTPALLFLPSLRAILTILHKLRTSCPSVRFNQSDMRGLTQALVKMMTLAPLCLRDIDRITDADAPAELRALATVALLETSLYAYGIVPGAEATVTSAWETVGTAPLQLSRALFSASAAARSERLPAEQIREAVRGLLGAFESDGALMLEIAVDDASSLMLSSTLRQHALSLIASLFSPGSHSTSAASSTAVGPLISTVGGVDDDNNDLTDAHTKSRATLLRALVGGGARDASPITRLIASLIELDAREEKQNVRGPPDASKFAQRGSMVPERADTTRKRLRDDTDSTAPLDDTLLPHHCPPLCPCNNTARVSLFGATLWALYSIASCGAGGSAVVFDSAGLIGILDRLTWLRRAARELTSLRASSLKNPTAGGADIDSSIALAVASASDRFLPFLGLLSAVLTARPRDAALATTVISILRRFPAIVDAIVVAALAPVVPLVILRLTTILIDIFTRCASLPGGLARSLSGGSADAERIDDLVRRLFRRYYFQPRACESARIQRQRRVSSSSSSSSLNQSLARPQIPFESRFKVAQHRVDAVRLLGEQGPVSDSDEFIWLRNILQPPSIPKGDSLPALTPLDFDVSATYPIHALARVGDVAVTAAQTAAMSAGEELASALARFCATRCQHVLLTPPGGGMDEAPIYFFRALEEAAAGEKTNGTTFFFFFFLLLLPFFAFG